MSTYNTFPISSDKSSYDTTYTPSWEVAEKVSANGTRRAITHQLWPKWKFSVKYPMLTKDEVETIMGFYNQCRGSLMPFYWQDSKVGLNYTNAKLLYNSKLGGMQIMHTLGGYSEPCPKAVVSKVVSNGFEITDYEYHESGSNCYITFDGASSLLPVTADYQAYFLVKFSGTVTITEKFNDFYSVNLTFEVVR